MIKNMLNSTCKCNRILINNLFKFFVWREVSKSFTRSIIEFIFNPLNLFVGYFTKVLTLWDILPDKPVGVFMAPRSMSGMVCKNRILFPIFAQFLVLCKLLSIVSRNCVY